MSKQIGNYSFCVLIYYLLKEIKAIMLNFIYLFFNKEELKKGEGVFKKLKGYHETRGIL